MINGLWLIPALIFGAVIGFVIAAVFARANGRDDEIKIRFLMEE